MKNVRQQRQQRGWICDECDTINLETESCARCGYLANYFRHSLNLYKFKGIWGTAKEWARIKSRSIQWIYGKAEDKRTKKL